MRMEKQFLFWNEAIYSTVNLTNYNVSYFSKPQEKSRRKKWKRKEKGINILANDIRYIFVSINEGFMEC